MTAASCPAPGRCPVPSPPPGGTASTITIPSGTAFKHVYTVHWGCDTFHDAEGGARFSPDTAVGDTRTLYGARDEAVALLESVLHNVTGAGAVLHEADVRRRDLAYLSTSRDLELLDLRDHALPPLGLRREQIVSSSAMHYACTGEWATWCLTNPATADLAGIIWNSRVAELQRDIATTLGTPPVPLLDDEVFVLFARNVPSSPGQWPLVDAGSLNLLVGPGRVLLDEIGETLDATVQP